MFLSHNQTVKYDHNIKISIQSTVDVEKLKWFENGNK
jgi:hypothetical protein